MAKDRPDMVPLVEEKPKFVLNQILLSKRFTGVEKDVISSILSKEEEYTLEEVNTAIRAYAERTVE